MYRLSLTSFLVLLTLSLLLTPVYADVREIVPGVRSNTVELLTYQDTGYKILILPEGAALPERFFQPDYDDTALPSSTGAFGATSGGVRQDCPLQHTVHTAWPRETQLLVRRQVTLPPGATNLRLMVSVDNDILGVFVNGKPLTEHLLQTPTVTHENCPILDEFRFDIPSSLVLPGTNLVAFHVRDRGGVGNESFFDTRLLAESPLLGPDTALVSFGNLDLALLNVSPLLASLAFLKSQSTPAPGLLRLDKILTLVSLITPIECFDQGNGDRLAAVGFFVGATGERAELQIERRGLSDVTVAYIIDRNLMYTAIYREESALLETARDFFRRSPAAVDQGLLAAGSVVARPEVLHDLLVCLQPNSPVASFSTAPTPSGGTGQALTLATATPTCSFVCDKIGQGVCTGSVAKALEKNPVTGGMLYAACQFALPAACTAICSLPEVLMKSCQDAENAAASQCSYMGRSFLTGFLCDPGPDFPMIIPGTCDTCALGKAKESGECTAREGTWISFCRAECDSGGDPFCSCTPVD
jgi:hypothetical protein